MIKRFPIRSKADAISMIPVPIQYSIVAPTGVRNRTNNTQPIMNNFIII